MRSGSSELLLEQQQQELRLRKLRELAPKKKNGNRRYRSWRERASFYGTSTLAFFSVTAGASLLFLVPLYVDPAISTLSHDFIDSPTLCTTTRREDLVGIFNCSWSSCREGCTSDLYKCVHIYVTFIEENITIPENMTDYTNYTADWTQSEEATLLVNIKGCGYPPTVTCKTFNAFYGVEGAIYPCYYSRKNKTVVLTSYNHDDQVNYIIHFFAVPFVITLISSIALCIWHCDCRCKKDRSHRRNRPQCRRPRIENLRYHDDVSTPAAAPYPAPAPTTIATPTAADDDDDVAVLSFC
ncbi:protein tipE [Calliphora vicina]